MHKWVHKWVHRRQVLAVREYTGGSVRKARGKWQGLIKYREVLDETDPLTGQQAKSGYKQLTKLFDIKSKPGKTDNTGKAKAEQMLKRWRDELVRGEEERDKEERVSTRSKGVTVEQYVSRFIDETAASVEPSTVSGYRKVLRNQISPYLGTLGIDELTPEVVAVWQQGLLKKYSPVTARKALMLLRPAMKQAVDRDLLSKDPTRTVRPPKLVKNRPNALDAAGRGKVIAFANIDRTDPLSLGILIILYCGLRESEACGLQWACVDVERLTFRIQVALGRADNSDIAETRSRSQDVGFSGVYLKGTKNESSTRIVRYPEELAKALRLRKSRMESDCAKAGVPFTEQMFVLGDVDGTPFHPHNFWRRWTAAATALGLVGTEGRPVTVGDLRHSYATAAVSNHVDIKTISSSMGHTNAAMTLNTYASADPQAAAQAAELLGRAYSEELRMAVEGGARASASPNEEQE